MSIRVNCILIVAATVALLSFSNTVSVAQDGQQGLAKQLANPIASLISVPIQMNYDRGIGPVDDGHRFTANIQPVVPFKLSSDLTLISRTIVPVISQEDIFPTAGSQFGLGDIVQSLFFSPNPIPLGGGASFIYGAGPVLLLPTGTDDLLSTEKWGAGPTAVGLLQSGPWTVGALANHIWSYAGNKNRADVSATFLQPFISYTTQNATTITLQSESTYDWETEEWAIPINFVVSQLTTIGDQPVSFAVGSKYWLESSTGGPEGWGFRFATTFLFPTN